MYALYQIHDGDARTSLSLPWFKANRHMPGTVLCLKLRGSYKCQCYNGICNRKKEPVCSWPLPFVYILILPLALRLRDEKYLVRFCPFPNENGSSPPSPILNQICLETNYKLIWYDDPLVLLLNLTGWGVFFCISSESSRLFFIALRMSKKGSDVILIFFPDSFRTKYKSLRQKENSHTGWGGGGSCRNSANHCIPFHHFCSVTNSSVGWKFQQKNQGTFFVELTYQLP